jgi:hypothetical protein
MNDITLMDILYTGGMLFLIFYGSIILTKIFAKDDGEKIEEDDTSENRSEK